MNHPDEGALRSLLDEELAVGEARALRAHLEGCSDCGAALRLATERQALTTALLGTLDAPAPIARVRERLSGRAVRDGSGAGIGRGRAWLRKSDLARAALLVLALTGAVAAAVVVPGSPLRHAFGLDRPVETVTTAAPAAVPTTPAVLQREVGVRVAVAAAGARVALTGAAPGQALEVTWVDREAAAVYAPEGTRFSSSDADGRIDAALARGAVRVELPERASRATLSVNGSVYVEKHGERIDYPGPPALVEGRKARFEVR